MRSLYFKIFVWFWAATALMVVAVAWSTLQFIQVRQSEHNPVVDGIARAGAVIARIAGELPRLDRPAIARLLDEAERRVGVKAYVIDAIGEDVRGGRLPPDLDAYMLDPLGVEFGAAPTLSRGAIVMRPFLSVNGEPLRLLANLSAVEPHDQGAFPPTQPALTAFTGPTPARFANELRWLRVAVAILVSGGVCYFLARYVTRPVRSLSDAARRLSQGDLGARVAAKMGTRQDEIAELARDFDAMAGRIQSLVHSQRRLLGDVSHELRSPLARLRVALELARQRGAGSAGSALDRIELEAERLDALIAQILAFTRLDEEVRKTRVTRSKTVDLGALLEEIAADAGFESAAAGKEISLERAIDATVQADPAQLRAALENIVRNAVRFSPPQVPVTVRMEGTPVKGAIGLTIRDRGPGVPESELPHLFEPFYRVDPSRSRDSGGHGLGLAIAERCIALHGGRIEARNADDGGLEVKVYLPGAIRTAPAA